MMCTKLISTEGVGATMRSDTTAAVLSTSEGPISMPAPRAAASGCPVFETATNRPRKRRSVVLVDGVAENQADGKHQSPNPNTDSSQTKSATANQERLNGTVYAQCEDSKDEEEQIKRQSKSLILHRAKSCVELVVGQQLLQSNNSEEHHNHEMSGEDVNIDTANIDGPVLHSCSSPKGIKRIKSEPSFVVLADTDAVNTSCVEDNDASNDGSSGNGSTDGLDGMKQLGLFTERPDSAIVSVDGSNESALAAEHHAQLHQQMPLHETQTQEEGVADDDVPSTPAYGVPPHPETCPADMDPDTFVKGMVHAYLGYEPRIRAGLSLPSPGFFPPITDDDLEAYHADVVSAVRENRMGEIRSYHEGGHNLSCCNRFGESLIHMACRRGYADAVTYLLEEANVSLRIRDDCGRTPLHDACWHRDKQYAIVDTIIRLDPALLFVSDKRGHTPFAYARREHWGAWRQFLFDRTEWIIEGFARKEITEIFGSADDQ